MSNFHIEWVDLEREPTQPPNPKYLDGIDLDLSKAATVTCRSALPYPAKRCGMYYVECRTCGTNAMVTTAGRLDDPRSIRLACKAQA